MKMSADLKDKMDLVAGVYSWEIINAKEITQKKEPHRNQIVVEFLVIEGQPYTNGDSSEGAEHTEFIDVTFAGLEGKGLKFMEGRLQGFVKALDKTMDEFRDLEAEDLVGEKINGTIKLESYQGEIRAKISAYSVYVE